MLRKVTVENGILQGIPAADPRITVFKGIPFAAPPVGELRWRAPQPAKNWEGVRVADTFGPIAMQETPGLDPNNIYTREWHVDSEIPMSEDCLYLNVWTPAKSSDEKLPVMFWIFGGGLQSGYPGEMEFDGERVARRGVILVSVCYRVNLFGFMTHPDLTAEDPDGIHGNFGLLDQKAGMEWVQRNIAAFGGDPNNVTIYGQSAGAGSTIMHLTSPLTKGLFHKAIVQSGGGLLAPSGDNLSLEKAQELGAKFLESIGVKTIAEARKLDAKYLYKKAKENTAPFMFSSINDGKYCTQNPVNTILENTRHQVPLIIGNTNNEFAVLPKAETMKEFEAFARKKFGMYADRYIEICKSGTSSVKEMCAKGKLMLFELGNILWGEKNVKLDGPPIYYYNFDPEIPGWDNPGSFHSSELWFTFETLAKCWRPFVGKHYDLARHICNYWTNFAKTGNPNGPDADGTPMPEWTPFTVQNPYPIHFGDKAEMDKRERSDLVKLVVESGDDLLDNLVFKMGQRD